MNVCRVQNKLRWPGQEDISYRQTSIRMLVTGAWSQSLVINRWGVGIFSDGWFKHGIFISTSSWTDVGLEIGTSSCSNFIGYRECYY